MIVAFSTSSPMASVALLADDGSVLAAESREARMNASAACLEMLAPMLDAHVHDVSGYLADLGPGSFTGVKVGVTLAKTMAMVDGVKAGGLSAFDLVDPNGLVVIPSKKGEFFWRMPGGEVCVERSLPKERFEGFGHGVEAPCYPEARGFAGQMHRIEWHAPETLLPRYVLEPSISTPNKPYRGTGG